MKPRANHGVHMYLSLDLPDEAAALKVAKDIAFRVAGPVTVTDDIANRIARVTAEGMSKGAPRGIG